MDEDDYSNVDYVEEGSPCDSPVDSDFSPHGGQGGALQHKKKPPGGKSFGARMETPESGVCNEEEEHDGEEVEEEVEDTDLTAEMVAASLSQLGHTPHGMLVYLRSDLVHLGLRQIDVIGLKYVHIQTLHLDHNRLTTLAPLRTLRNLVVLTASHNQLTAAGVAALVSGAVEQNASQSNFSAKRQASKIFISSQRGLAAGGQSAAAMTEEEENDRLYPLRRSLQRLDLSHNAIESVTCIKSFEYAHTIDLSHNQLSGEISDQCIHGMTSLVSLNMAHNALTAIDTWALDGCVSLRDLDVSSNELTKADFVSMVAPSLRVLRMASNSIMDCKCFAGLLQLVTLDISANNIFETGEISHLNECESLRTLWLEGNPAFRPESVQSPTDTTLTGTAAADGAALKPAASMTAEALATLGATRTSRAIAVIEGKSLTPGDESGGGPLAAGVDGDDEAAVDDVEIHALERRHKHHIESQQGSRRQLSSSTPPATAQASARTAVGGGLNNSAGPPSQYAMRSAHLVREAVTTPFNAMLMNLQRRKDIDMAATHSIKKTTLTLQQGSSAAAGAAAAAGPSSGAGSMLLTPDEEDALELQQLQPREQLRLKVLWRLPRLAELDGEPVGPQELALAECLEGGTDRRQRQEAKARAFGSSAATASVATGGGKGRNSNTSAGGGAALVQSLRRQQQAHT